MKTVLALLLLIVPVFAADSAASKEIDSAFGMWKTAMLKGDGAALDKLYHSDLIYVHSNANNETKAEAIKSSTKPGTFPKAIDVHSVATRIYGTTGVVNAKVDITNAAGEVSRLDLLMVWLRTPQGWQLTARHATKLP